MDRNITNEVNKWVNNPHFSCFQKAFWAFENENFEAGRILQQKDIERFQEKAKVPLVGEIHRSMEDSNTAQGLESTGKVIQFSPCRQFKASEHLKKLFFDFPHIKFVPGIVYFQPGRIYPDDYEALKFLKGSLRILKGLCLSAIGEGRIEEQSFLSSDLSGTFICTGGPVSNAISRIAMQYGRKERDPEKGLLRTIEPIINLRYEPVYDVQEVISEAGHIVRFVDNQIHRAPNWFIRDTRSGELLKPAKCKEDNFLTSDFLLISILPNILDRESYDRGDKIQIFGGTHGVGTRAVELVCSDNSLIDQINGLAGKLQYWQVLLEIDEIDHSKGQSRPVSLGSDIRWCEVTFNETELDEWFGRDPLSSNHFHRSNVIKNGRVQLTASRASVYSPMESEGAGVPEREATVEAGPSFPAARGEEKSVGEDSSESIHGDVQSPLVGKVKEHIPGKGERAMCLEASELTENSEPKEKIQDSQGREKSENPSHWKRSYGSYANSELRALRFDSTEEIDRAIDLIWSDPDLRNLPSDIVDGLTLVVPEDSVEYFRAKALQFTVSKIVDPGELSREKLAQIRMRYGM